MQEMAAAATTTTNVAPSPSNTGRRIQTKDRTPKKHKDDNKDAPTRWSTVFHRALVAAGGHLSSKDLRKVVEADAKAVSSLLASCAQDKKAKSKEIKRQLKKWIRHGGADAKGHLLHAKN